MDDLTDLGDFTATRRMIPIAALAIAVGILATFVAELLLLLIALCTNLAYFQRWSLAPASPAAHHLGLVSVVVPVAGALIIGLMARYGSERIRGHRIPEALEAIMTRGSRVQARVALLKPISSAISIGSGGPYGAEGPIIMTGGARARRAAGAARRADRGRGFVCGWPTGAPGRRGDRSQGHGGRRERGRAYATLRLALHGGFDLQKHEVRLLELAVQHAQGNLTHAAKLLGITRRQLAYRLKQADRDAPD